VIRAGAITVGAGALLAAGAALALPGELDPSWGGDGVVRVALLRPTQRDRYAEPFLLLYDRGRIVAAGGARSAFVSGPLAVRFLRDGRLDRTFGRGGIVRGRGIVSAENWRAGVVFPDGSMLLLTMSEPTGGFRFRMLAARLTRAGRLDRRFGRRGRIRHAVVEECENLPNDALGHARGAVTVLLDACAPLGGEAAGGFWLLRLRRDGRLDRTFGARGKRWTPLPVDVTATDLAQQRDGRLVVSGAAHDPALPGLALVRFRRDGRLDRSFGRGGKVVIRWPFYSGGTIVPEDGHRLLVVACNEDGARLLRFRVNGARDRSFGRDGSVDVRNVVPGCPEAVRAPGGKLVLISENTVARVDRNGSPDPSFGSGGRIRAPSPLDAVLVQPNGAIVTAASVVVGRMRGWELRRYQG
jgi:uncharacterized delta-60 repeat protein